MSILFIDDIYRDSEGNIHKIIAEACSEDDIDSAIKNFHISLYEGKIFAIKKKSEKKVELIPINNTSPYCEYTSTRLADRVVISSKEGKLK